MTTTKDVVVVGGGLAGLAAGATAARAGASVLVLDAHPLGGRARSVERDGFVFNMGAHALYRGGPGMAVLRGLGITPQGFKPPLARYHARYRGEDHVLPASTSGTLRTRILGPRGKARFSAFMVNVLRLDPARFATTSVTEWVDGAGLRPDVADVVRALVRIGTYADDFDRLSADAAVAQLQAGARKGVLYLDGGWQQLIDGLAAQVEVRTGAGADVQRIEPASGRVEVVTGGGTIVARSVVLAPGSPAATRGLLPAGTDPGWGDLGEPVTAACLDTGVRRVPAPGWVLGVDEPLYVTTQSPPAAGQAPEGAAVVSVLRYGATTPDADRADMEAFLGYAGVGEDDVVTRRFLARMVVTATAPAPRNGGLAGRPGVADTGVANVFMAGDWVGPDGLLADASLASGRAAAERAVAAAGSGRSTGRSATMVS
jgi:phytoene dehydrogenase-like protein